MRKFGVGITCIPAALLIALIAGCGQEVVTVPTVVSKIPANGATNVVINTTISATFNEAMSPATINTTSFTVAGPGGTVAGAVTYSGTVATFTPAAPLAYPRHNQRDNFHADRAGRNRREWSCRIQWRNCDVHAQRQSRLQHGLHCHNYKRGNERGRHSAACQLRVDLHNNYPTARGDRSSPCEWRHQCAHRPGAQRDL